VPEEIVACEIGAVTVFLNVLAMIATWVPDGVNPLGDAMYQVLVGRLASTVTVKVVDQC
jgi:hypothetical protein